MVQKIASVRRTHAKGGKERTLVFGPGCEAKDRRLHSAPGGRLGSDGPAAPRGVASALIRTEALSGTRGTASTPDPVPDMWGVVRT